MNVNRLIAVVLFAACGTATPPPPDPDADPLCARELKEPDFDGFGWQGAGVTDGGVVVPPAAGTTDVISSTYIRLKTDADSRKQFNKLNGPILAQLPTQDGLVAYQFASSDHCLTAHTLLVWR